MKDNLAMPQPSKVGLDGVILTVGGFSGTDRAACVIPLFTDDVGLTRETRNQDAVTAFRTTVLSQFLACISGNSQVTYLQSEGMANGSIPAREDYASGAHPGTGASNALPSNVTSLVVFYEEPADVVPPHRMRVGKQFIWGVPQATVTGDIISVAQIVALQTFASSLLLGFPTNHAGGNWYRAVAHCFPRLETTPIKRCGSLAVRDYVATQRRRLIPHN
jgi:hypothetical protein